MGAVATVADVTLLTAMLDVAHAPLRLASPVALLAGVAVQFVGSRRFTFQSTDPRRVRQVLLFAAVEALAFVLNVALTEVASRALRLPAPVVRVPVTSLVYFGVSMPLWRRVFASEEVAS